MTSLSAKRPREEDDPSEPSRPRKRPGGGSRISKTEVDPVLARQHLRAEIARRAATTRGVDEVVRQHYNAVPQRGREWRKTDSRIKGLRSFNNWVKSTLIHKFSPEERGGDKGLIVLDLGCGKGGDLGKWAQAPQALELYVGVDPAEVSIEQARERFAQMRSGGGGRGGRERERRGGFGGRPQRTFNAKFFVRDAFSYLLSDLPLIRQVGFGDGARSGPKGGFDVVSMMFCMHYAYETEAKAKGMLRNVAGCLKKGGRFIGVIPNSDVIRAGVEAFHARQEKVGALQTANGASPGVEEEGGKRGDESPPYMIGKEPTPPFAPQSPAYFVGEKDEVNGTDTRNTAEPAPGATPAINTLTEAPTNLKEPTEIPTTSPAPSANHTREKARETSDNAPSSPLVAEWGNSIYRIRFPGPTPKDGIFRPPYGWKYSFFMEEAVEEVPEYIVPWEAFRAYDSPLSSPHPPKNHVPSSPIYSFIHAYIRLKMRMSTY